MIYDQTVRKLIITNLRDRFLARTKGVDGAKVTWDFVETDPLTENQMGAGRALGIYVGSERVKQIIGWDEKWMTVFFEFHVKVLEGDSAGDALEDTLGDVQSTIFSDINCGGLTIDINEKGCDTDPGFPTDRIAKGALAVEVRYRHRTGNPYSA